MLPRLAARGVGLESDVRTLRLTGIGESLVAERLGEPLLRATNPIVATYARQEAVDIRISAHAADGVTAATLADEAEAAVAGRARTSSSGRRGDTTWAGALAEALDAPRLDARRRVESGTDGALVALLRAWGRAARPRSRSGEIGDGRPGRGRATWRDAERAREAAGADVGVRGPGRPRRGNDTAVARRGASRRTGRHAERRLVFLRGSVGADRGGHRRRGRPARGAARAPGGTDGRLLGDAGGPAA